MTSTRSPLATRRLSLRPIVAPDLDFLYSLAVDPRTAVLSKYRGRVPDPATFGRDIWVGVHAQYMIELASNREPIGYTSSYGYSDQGYCYLGLWAKPEAWRTGLAVEGAAIFVDYLFANWPLRKIYCEMLDVAAESIGSGIGRYLVEEGRLREHEYFAGGYHDLMFLSIYRSTWVDSAHNLIEQLR